MNYKKAIALFSVGFLSTTWFMNCSGHSGFAIKGDAFSSADSASYSSESTSWSSELPESIKSQFAATVPYAKRLLSGQRAGAFDDNCIGNAVYDACLFYKNPVAQRQKTFESYIDINEDLTGFQTFGVKYPLGPDSSGLLRNSELSIGESYTSSKVQDQSYTSGQGIVGSHSAKDRRLLSQIIPFFWLSYLSQELSSRAGLYYAKTARVFVDTLKYSDSMQFNAYFTSPTSAEEASGQGGRITLGYAWDEKNDGDAIQELALSAEIPIHEMGHANLYAAQGMSIVDKKAKILVSYANATNKKVYTMIAWDEDYPPNATALGSFCDSSVGCFSAINEGLADFHVFLIFPDRVHMGETVFNDPAPDYFSSSVPRNVLKLTTATASKIFANSTTNVSSGLLENPSQKVIHGEIHDLGSFFASILWDIYSDPDADKRAFEKTFMAWLPMLTGSADFSTAKSQLLEIDSGQMSGVNQTIIKSVFSKKGISQ